MKKITDKYTNNTFENIKHTDDYGNEFWFARELQKVLEWKCVLNYKYNGDWSELLINEKLDEMINKLK